MVRRLPPANAPVVPGSTPVVAFGDPGRATVATLGINPSAREFLRDGRLMRGAERRLATLESLGAERLDQLSDRQIGELVGACASYFQRNPYRRWFDPLDQILRACGGVSYYEGTACHLDLVQWATDPVWGGIADRSVQAALLADGTPHLRAQLAVEGIRIVLLNGRQVVDQARAAELAPLEEVGRLKVGSVDSRLYVGVTDNDTRWLGWSVNLQSGFGISNEFKRELAVWLAGACAAASSRNSAARADRPSSNGTAKETAAYFVQFPHPGGEHNPPADEMPWNVEDHRRKFLITPGRYVGPDEQTAEGEFVLWGEWEPPSRIVQRWPSSSRLPRALHRPYWFVPSSNGFRQNTDPWIWGDTFFYSCCKQGPSMRRLTRGSVICFGSTIENLFCLDTVFVIASAEPWMAAEAEDLDAPEAFIVCTAGSIASNEDDARIEFTLYRGATIDDPIDGMFSFVPARSADHSIPRFARPAIRLPGLINPASRQSTWGSKRPLDVADVRRAWDCVSEQVIDADLVRAVHLQIPTRVDGGAALFPTTRSGC